MSKISRIEISFPVPVELPDGWERVLMAMVDMTCNNYQKANPDRVMWPAGVGSKPRWSQADAAFLGQAPDPAAPEGGEPTFDDSVLVIDCAEREDYHGSNPHNPRREELRAASRKRDHK